MNKETADKLTQLVNTRIEEVNANAKRMVDQQRSFWIRTALLCVVAAASFGYVFGYHSARQSLSDGAVNTLSYIIIFFNAMFLVHTYLDSKIKLEYARNEQARLLREISTTKEN